MFRSAKARSTAITLPAITLTVLALSLSGCVGVKDYVRNGFKVGPSYCISGGNTAERWIEDTDGRVRQDVGDLSCWWTVFQDPVLDELIANAQVQNLSLREAGFRVLQARAQLGIARGNLFPQSQYGFGGYRHSGTPVGPPVPIIAEVGPNNPLPEGTIISCSAIKATLLTSGTMVSAWPGNSISGDDTAARLRRQNIPWKPRSPGTTKCWLPSWPTSPPPTCRSAPCETRIEFVQQNIAEQRKIARIIRQLHEIGDPRPERRFEQPRQYHVDQIESILAQTESAVPQLQIELRCGLQPAVCVVRHPAPRLAEEIPPGPDSDRSERGRRRHSGRPAAPATGYSPRRTAGCRAGGADRDCHGGVLSPASRSPARWVGQLRNSSSVHQPGVQWSVGPSFHWNILNYGRILNNVRVAGCALPRIAGDLPIHGPAGERRGREAAWCDSCGPKSEPQPSTEAWPTCRRRWQESRGQGTAGRGRESNCDYHPNQSPAARSASPVARRNRSGPDPGVPGDGRGLGDPRRSPARRCRSGRPCRARRPPRSCRRPRERFLPLPNPCLRARISSLAFAGVHEGPRPAMSLRA